MGISEIEFIGSGDEGDDGDGAGEPGRSSGSGAASGTARRGYPTPTAPILALLVVALAIIAAAAFAVAPHREPVGDDFGVKLVSAQYKVRQDASGIDLTLALQNTGSTMIELTGVSVYQPGLIRLGQTGDRTGATESEAGATTASALGPGTAIASQALTPEDVALITVPFRYDCGVSTFPPVSRSLGLAGFSARGTARTAQITLPANVTPWEGGDVVRSALCSQLSLSAQSDLAIDYGGTVGSTQITQGQLQSTYVVLVSGRSPDSVTVSSLSLDNPGVTTTVSPRPPITVIDGATIRLAVTWRVTNCVVATSANSADGVKITASAGERAQTWDVQFGAGFTKDIADGISARCSGN